MFFRTPQNSHISSSFFVCVSFLSEGRHKLQLETTEKSYHQGQKMQRERNKGAAQGKTKDKVSLNSILPTKTQNASARKRGGFGGGRGRKMLSPAAFGARRRRVVEEKEERNWHQKRLSGSREKQRRWCGVLMRTYGIQRVACNAATVH